MPLYPDWINIATGFAFTLLPNPIDNKYLNLLGCKGFGGVVFPSPVLFFKVCFYKTILSYSDFVGGIL